MPYYSPLRYPGGKRKISDFMKLGVEHNNSLDGEYVEPFAGGAAVALALLLEQYVARVWINDLDPGVHAFWWAVLNDTDGLCRLIHTVEVSMGSWRRQKAIQDDPDASPLELGFSTFFLNRTNRSGVIKGGVIGGKGQTGAWGLGARFTREDLVRRIERIASHEPRIRLTKWDGGEVLQEAEHGGRTLVYVDPPYISKGAKLYRDHLTLPDHEEVSRDLRASSVRWVVSYDNCAEVRRFYAGFRSMVYDLHYSAARRYEGSELMFFSEELIIPPVSNPALLPREGMKEMSTTSETG